MALIALLYPNSPITKCYTHIRFSQFTSRTRGERGLLIRRRSRESIVEEESQALRKGVFEIRAWESIYITVWKGLLGNHRGLVRVN